VVTSVTGKALDDAAASSGMRVEHRAIGNRHDPRTRVLLEAPIASTLVRLAAQFCWAAYSRRQTIVRRLKR
jgi:hypothetical protein